MAIFSFQPIRRLDFPDFETWMRRGGALRDGGPRRPQISQGHLSAAEWAPCPGVAIGHTLCALAAVMNEYLSWRFLLLSGGKVSHRAGWQIGGKNSGGGDEAPWDLFLMAAANSSKAIPPCLFLLRFYAARLSGAV